MINLDRIVVGSLRQKIIIISTKIHQSLYPTSGIHLKRRTYITLLSNSTYLSALNSYPNLTPPTVENIFQSNQSPSGPVYTKKSKIFSDLKPISFERENTLQNYQGKRATYTIQNDRGVILTVPLVCVGS